MIQSTGLQNTEKLFSDPFFRETLSRQIREINTKIGDFEYGGKQLKRNAVNRLEDDGYWNVNGLINVYTEYYILCSTHYPMAVRSLISSMILSAAKETAAHYNLQSLKQNHP
jgi:hypothetical protein